MKLKLFYVVILCSILLGACKSNNVSIVSADQVDRVSIYVKDDQGQIQEWVAQDPNFLKSLLGNIKLLFNESDRDSLPFGLDLLETQKEFDYKIEFYNQDQMVQEINISQRNVVTVDKDEFIIEDKEKELNSLKSQLILVTR